jgi:hypothetical protein
MTMMTGFDRHEIDFLDEEYLGPPPRFLLEDRPADYRVAGIDFAEEEQAEASAFDRLKSLLGIKSC